MSGPFSLFVFSLDGLNDGVGPRLHGGCVVVHETLVLDISLDIIPNGDDGELDGDSSGDLDGGVTDVRDELLDVLPGLGIFAFKREIHLFEQLAQDVELILYAPDHQVTIPEFGGLHFVTYSNKR